MYYFGLGIYEFIETNRLEYIFKEVEYLEKAVTFVSDYKQDIMNFLAWINFSKKKLEKAEYWCSLLYAINPFFPGVANNYAIILNNLGRVEEAEKLYI